MTNAEWIALYPEDWHPASKAKDFSPERYQHIWNEDYSFFRAVRLSWAAGNQAYIDYQSGY